MHEIVDQIKAGELRAKFIKAFVDTSTDYFKNKACSIDVEQILRMIEPSGGFTVVRKPLHTPMISVASYITSRPLRASAMRGLLSDNTLPIFRTSLYTFRVSRILPRQNLSAGDFHPRISSRLRFEIVRHRVDHNRPPDNFRNCKPIRQKA